MRCDCALLGSHCLLQALSIGAQKRFVLNVERLNDLRQRFELTN
jgi:hypothetical protein